MEFFRQSVFKNTGNSFGFSPALGSVYAAEKKKAVVSLFLASFFFVSSGKKFFSQDCGFFWNCSDLLWSETLQCYREPHAVAQQGEGFRDAAFRLQTSGEA